MAQWRNPRPVNESAVPSFARLAGTTGVTGVTGAMN